MHWGLPRDDAYFRSFQRGSLPQRSRSKTPTNASRSTAPQHIRNNAECRKKELEPKMYRITILFPTLKIISTHAIFAIFILATNTYFLTSLSRLEQVAQLPREAVGCAWP